MASNGELGVIRWPPNVLRRGNSTQGLLGTGQQLVFQSNDVDKRLDAVEIGELHPAVPHALKHRSIAHGLLDDPRQAVSRADLLLLGTGQHEGAADARLHRVQISQLAAADFVHPHPLPRGAEVDHLLGHMPETAEVFAGFLEPLRRAGREVACRLIGLGPLARAQVEMTRPVFSGWLVVHGAPKVQARSRGEIERDRAAGRTTVAALRYVHPAPWPT